MVTLCMKGADFKNNQTTCVFVYILYLQAGRIGEERRYCYGPDRCTTIGGGAGVAAPEDFTSWSTCSRPCGGGRQFKLRLCKHGQNNCVGKLMFFCLLFCYLILMLICNLFLVLQSVHNSYFFLFIMISYSNTFFVCVSIDT